MHDGIIGCSLEGISGCRLRGSVIKILSILGCGHGALTGVVLIVFLGVVLMVSLDVMGGIGSIGILRYG